MSFVYNQVLYGPQYTISDSSGTPQVTINTTDANGVDWILTKETGWFASAPPKPARTNKAGATGSYRSQNFRGERIISLEGTMTAPTITALRTAQHQLAAVCGDPAQLYTLSCAEETGTLTAQVELDAQILMTPIAYLTCAWTIQLAAPDPTKYSSTLQQASTFLPSATGGLDWSTGGGLDWSTGGGLNWGTTVSNGTVAVLNGGTAPTWPTFTVNAGTGITNPTITCSTTGQVLQYASTLNSGDQLVISTSPFNRYVQVNGSDRRPFLTTSQWFSFSAATAYVLAFSASSYSSTASLAVSWYPAYH
jgi:hypothetical protein